MTRPQLFIGGRQIELGNRIGKGGEGEVLARVDQPDQAVKLYGSPDRQREAKIEAMVAAGLHRASPLVAFPMATVRDRSGRFAGFSMRRVSGHRPLHDLYAPGARKASFPTADYRFLIRSAHNIAIAVAQVHSAGSVIGDINHSGFLISEKAMAAIIDADSFQFGAVHPCRVGVPEYTPPELQGRRLGEVVRTTKHDAFGLAIVVFQLLFMGRHPFAGRFADGDVPIEKAIREGRFVYSRLASVRGTRPPGAAGLGSFPDDLGSLFEAAFGSAPDRRPEAAAWAAALQVLERSLSHCRDNDLHYFPSAAGSCLWCEMERASGVVLFTSAIPQPVHHHDPGSLGFDVEAAWRAIEAVKLPGAEISPLLPSFNLSPSPEAVEVRAKRTQRRLSGIVLMIAAAALLGWQPSLWLLALPLGWWGYARIYGSNADTQSLEQSYRTAAGAYAVALADWKRGTGIDELLARKKELAAARIGYGNLPEQKRKKLQLLHDNRRANQLRRHLESHRISRARLRGIGPGKIAGLASYGIETAADVNGGRILQVPGFGPVAAQTLVDWRTKMEARFRYIASPTAQDRQDEDRVIREADAEAARLRVMLAGGASEMKAAAASVLARTGRTSPALAKSAQDLEQAKIDLAEIGSPTPSLPVPAARGATAVPRQAPRATPRTITSGSSGLRPINSTAGCPKCGSTMQRRLARRGRNVGGYFMGCSRYPSCTGTRSL